MTKNWGSMKDRLAASRLILHNDDYLLFLIERVWRIDSRRSIIDFGCGEGWLGSKLLPMLPRGCDYVGVDLSELLLMEAITNLGSSDYRHSFACADCHNVPFRDASFDIALSHTLLAHATNPLGVLAEMIRVVRPGGLVIAFEPTQICHMAALYSSSVEYPIYELGFMARLQNQLLMQENVDCNIGVKLPSMMRQLGLNSIQCRLSDRVVCSLFDSGSNAGEGQLLDALASEGYGKWPDGERCPDGLARLLSLTSPESDQSESLRRTEDNLAAIREKIRESDLVFTAMVSISFGFVAD